jgi:cytochrome b561
MMMNNTTTTYGSISKSLHWAMAVLFLGMFTVAYIMINISGSGFKFTLFDLHKATGLLLFALVTIRLAWCLCHVRPRLPSSVPLWQQHVARGNIVVLYVLMFAMPITGFLTSTLGGHDINFYKLFTISPLAHNKSASGFFSQAHELLSYLLIAAFVMHVMGALYHHYILKDRVLRRMWIGQSNDAMIVDDSLPRIKTLFKESLK